MSFATIPGYTATSSAAAVTLEDIYDPTLFNQAVQEAAIESNAFLASGVMVTDPRIDAMASGEGSVGDLPFYLGLTNDEPDYVDDDPTASSTPAALTSGKMTYRKAFMHKSWSTMDLAREIASADPMGAITSRIGHYWGVNTNKRVINSAQGVMLDNIANDSNDMVNAIHSESIAGQTAANFITADDIIDTIATMGDKSGDLAAMAMHSTVYHNLQKQQLITYFRDTDNNVAFDTYLGKFRVIVDDLLAPRAGTTDGLVYTTILFAGGAFAYGRGSPQVPSEIDRKPDTGNGGGQDVIHSRATEIIHPWGFAFDDSSVTGMSPTYAELAAAAQWNRVYAERKNVGLAFITSNG
jgi:hypothetical protein